MSILLSEAAAPSTPATGKVALYSKTDGRIYGKDDVGTEFNMSGIASGTPVTASGTAVDFTGIPSGAKKITVMFEDVSLSGTDNFLIQLGDSGGFYTTGYTSTSVSVSTTPVVTAVSATNGFIIRIANAALAVTGQFIFTKLSDTIWVGTSSFTSTGGIFSASGKLSGIAGNIDSVRFTKTGANTFDSGTINILYA